MTPLLFALALAGADGNVEVWRASPQSPRVVLAPSDGPDAALRIVFLAGAADDGLEEGLTRLTQFALLHGQGGAAFADLDGVLYGADADLEVSTGVRECSFDLYAPRGTFDAAARKLLAQVLAPHISREGVERARRIVTTDILEVGGTDWLDAYIAADVLVTEGVDGGGDYNNPIWGDLDTLRRIPAASVQRHITKKLSPANAVIVATGRFDVAALKAAVAKYRGGVERKTHRPDISKLLPLEREHPSPREVHMLVQVVDVPDAKTAAAVQMLAAALQDRLFFKLRKSGHVYSPFFRTTFEEWLDFVSVGFEVTKGDHADLGKVMFDDVDELADGKIDDAGFSRAKALARTHLLDVEADPRAYAHELVARSRGEVTVGPEVRAALEGLDRAALIDAAQRFLGRNRSVSFVFGGGALAPRSPR